MTTVQRRTPSFDESAIDFLEIIDDSIPDYALKARLRAEARYPQLRIWRERREWRRHSMIYRLLHPRRRPR